MFGVPILVLIAVALTALSLAVSRFGPLAKMARLYPQAYAAWESGDLDSAEALYGELHRRSDRLRHRPTRLSYQFIALQALGAIDRSRERFGEAASKLSLAMELVDEEVDQTSEVVLVTCIELAFAYASMAQDDKARQVAARVQEEFDALPSSEKVVVCRTLLPHVTAAAGNPGLYAVARQILSGMSGSLAEVAEEECEAEPHSNRLEELPLGRSTGGLNRQVAVGADTPINAYRPAPEVNESGRSRSSASRVLMDCLIGHATIAEYVSDHSETIRLLDEIQSSPWWWKLDAAQSARANELRARCEHSRGSILKALEMGRAVFESQCANGADPFIQSSTEIGLSSFLRARGEYRESLKHAKSAYDRIVAVAPSPFHVSSWYPSLYALALMETGQHAQVLPLLEEASANRPHDETPVSRAYTQLLRALYLRSLGRLESAEIAIRESLNTVVAAYGEDTHHSSDQKIVLASILLLQERIQEAEVVFRDSELSLLNTPSGNAYSEGHRILIASSLDVIQGRLGEAAQKLDRFEADLRGELLPHHHLFVGIHYQRGILHREAGKIEAAIDELNFSRQLRRKTQPDDCPDFLHALLALENLCERNGDETAIDEVRSQLEKVRACQAACG